MSIVTEPCPRCGKLQQWDSEKANGKYKCPVGWGCSVLQPIYDIGNYNGNWVVRITSHEPSKAGLYAEVSKTFATFDGAVNYVKAMMDEVK